MRGRMDRDLIHNGRRKNDHSLVTRLADLGMRYNWLLILLFSLLLLLGFGFKTPRDSFAEINEKIDDNTLTTERYRDTLQRQINQGQVERDYLKSLLESSLTAQCLALPKTITRPAALPCARLLRERGIE